MKKILGLDMGSSSIGWAVVELGTENPRIVNMGSRIVPLTPDDETQFTRGQAITKNSARTSMRTTRKGYDRYQMRRENLREILISAGMKPVDIIKPIELWRLRSDAVDKQISLGELARILMHINQKRGYKSGKDDFSDSTKSKYVQSVNENYIQLKENKLTLGQYFYQELTRDGSFRVKDRVYPRKAYVEEFDAIIEQQRKHYPDILTDSLVKKIKDETIFYQRRLKSCKHLVSICEFEKKEYRKSDGGIVISGPRTAPKSSPIAQICKIWEFINTISFSNKLGEYLPIDIEQKKQIFAYLQTHEKLKVTDLQKILGIGKRDGWWTDKSVFQRTIGNTTLIRITKALDGKYSEFLSFSPQMEEYPDTETGEVKKIISESFKTEPMYRLWHTLYSISDIEELDGVLKNKFGIDDESVVAELNKIDFVKEGYCNKSATAIRKILPYLMDGYVYSDACCFAGYNHSGFITKEENLAREL